MNLYNEDYISTFSIDSYRNLLNDNTFQQNIINQYTNRYNAYTEARVLLFKESLDHYILKNLIEKPNYINSSEMLNYINYIIKIINSNFTEINTNVVFQNKEICEKLINKFFKNSRELIEKKYKNNNDRLYNILNKISKNISITQDELDFASIYMSNLRKPELVYENETLLKFIYGKMKDTDLKFSKQAQDFVVSYMPYHYSKEINNKSKNVRVVFSNTDKGIPINGPGHSTNSSNYIVLNRDYFKCINNKSILNSNVERLARGNDITFFTIVCFHEITHQIQKEKSKSKFIDDDGLGYIMHLISNIELKDYSYNHDSDVIEIDANKVGWKACNSFYYKFYSGTDKQKLISNCVINAHTSDIRRLFAYKKNKLGEYIPYEDYDIENLRNAIAKRPEYLNEYPMLKNFFNPNGKLKLDLMLNNSLYTKPNCMLFVNFFFGSNGIDVMDDYLLSKKYSNDKITNLLNNMYYYIKGKINSSEKFDYVIRHKSTGEYRNNEEFSLEVANRLSKTYYKTALYSYKKAIPLLNKIKTIYKDEEKYINFIFEDLNKRFNIKEKSIDKVMISLDEKIKKEMQV